MMVKKIKMRRIDEQPSSVNDCYYYIIIFISSASGSADNKTELTHNNAWETINKNIRINLNPLPFFFPNWRYICTMI